MYAGPRLELTAKLRHPAVWPTVIDVANGQTPEAPLVVELDPTSFCDSACPECISGPLLNQKRFTSSRLRSLADEMADAGVRAVILIGGGEPLMHPAIGTVIDTLFRRGLQIALTTNGTQLDRYLSQIADSVSWTRVSVDAGSPATFEAFRPHRTGVNQFTHVIDNMRALAERKHGSLGYSFAVFTRTGQPQYETNVYDILPAARLARDVGCDYFELKPSYDMSHYLLSLPAEILAELENSLRVLPNLATEHFEVISPHSLRETLAGKTRQPKGYDTCAVAQLRTLITPSGAFICPYHRGKDFANFGDPTTRSFKELWQGDRRREVMGTVQPSSSCPFHCIRHEANLLIGDALQVEPPPSSADPVDYFI